MPPGVEPSMLVPAAFIVLAGSLVKSTTGFGFAMVAAPLLLLIWEPVVMVPVLLPLVFTVDALIVAQNWWLLDLRRVAPLAIAGVVGIPLGTFALLLAPPQALKLGVAAVTLVSAVLLLKGATIPISRERLAGGVAGFLSGTLITSTGLSGPPVVLFMINQRWAKETFRNSLGLFFIFMDTAAIISLATTSTLTGKTLLVSAVLWPMVLVGYLIGRRLLPLIPQRTFLRIATVIVMAAAVLAMASAVM